MLLGLLYRIRRAGLLEILIILRLRLLLLLLGSLRCVVLCPVADDDTPLTARLYP